MKNALQTLLLGGLVAVLLLISVGDLFPRFSLVDESVSGLSGLLGISYARSLDLFAALGLVLVGVCYLVALKKRL